MTICVKNRQDAFGRIFGGEMVLSDAGKIAGECWNELPEHYSNCRLDYYVVMPNHFHGIVEIVDDASISGSVTVPFPVVRTGFKPVLTSASVLTDTVPTGETLGKKPHGLPEIIRGFKTFSSRKIHEKTDFVFRWQKSYYDRIIRNERELKNIRRYIENNVLLWQMKMDDMEFYDHHITIP